MIGKCNKDQIYSKYRGIEEHRMEFNHEGVDYVVYYDTADPNIKLTPFCYYDDDSEIGCETLIEDKTEDNYIIDKRKKGFHFDIQLGFLKFEINIG